ncbi:MAG TPA: MarR family transcriptional regulator [Sphingobium sp.]|nr:MarR family transcriptional regulator [Sphingobium sp.]
METNVAFLCNDIARLFRKRFCEEVRDTSSSGSTGAQWRALLIVERDQGISQGMLAERLDVEPITACRMVDRLEQAGFVERRRHPDDRRVRQLFLTETGTRVVCKLKEVGARTLDSALSRLSEDEVEHLTQFLLKVRDTLSGEDDIAAERRVG